VPYARTLTIAGNGYLAVTGNSGAAIGGREEYLSDTRRCGNIQITGGRIVARGSSSAIGSCDGQSCGDIVISGGTVDAETTSGQAIGTGGAFSQQTVVITGGSVKTTDAGAATVAVNASDAALSCVEVPGLSPGAAVAFDGLPEDYGTDCIYADADGKVWLWLPENWTETVKPQSSLPAKRSAAGANGGTTHEFSANGWRYTVTIDEKSGSAVSEQGEALRLETVAIRNFAIENGKIVIDVEAMPATWLYGAENALSLDAAYSLDAIDSDESATPLPGQELHLIDGVNARITIPLQDDGKKLFLRVKGPLPR
ncbi:MAG: hypothetical protein IIT98_03020, partial [Kiritimatiellae bacterium]|nr:hypothetical protein [Kiritimatiellia bacterium]